MKTKAGVALILMLSMLLQGACAMKISAEELSAGYRRTVVAEGENSEEFYNAVSRFSFELFSKAVESGEGNRVLSPISVMICLAMLSNGACGSTRTEIEAALRMNREQLNSEFARYMATCSKEEGASLEIANSLWLREGAISVREAFLVANGEYYSSDVYAAPFDKSTVEDINLWVKEKTDGMIPRLLDEVSPAQVMLAINTVLFLGEWENRYFPENVREGEFTAESGEKVNVTMLSSVETTYFPGESSQGFLRKYAGGKYGFVGILPNEDMDFYDFVSGFGSEDWNALWQMRESMPVSVKIPEFSYGSDIDMIPFLKEMGMLEMFACDADFSDLSTTESLSCDLLRQKAEITVSQKGTKAAAATVAGIRMTSMDRLDAERTIVLDRPFLYMIVDTESGIPVFIGTVTRP